MRYRLTAAAGAVALVVAGLGAGAAEAAKKPRKRQVLVVSNNWAGTADLVDPRTFKRLKRLDVVPDKAARIAEIGTDPTAKFYYDSIRRSSARLVSIRHIAPGSSPCRSWKTGSENRAPGA